MQELQGFQTHSYWELYVSEVIYNELKNKDNIEVIRTSNEVKFDENGYFIPM